MQLLLCLQISSDRQTSSASIRHRTCTAACPNLCTRKWEFWNHGEWKVDEELEIVCRRTDRCCSSIIFQAIDDYNNATISLHEKGCGSIAYDQWQYYYTMLGEYVNQENLYHSVDQYHSSKCEKYLYKHWPVSDSSDNGNHYSTRNIRGWMVSKCFLRNQTLNESYMITKLHLNTYGNIINGLGVTIYNPLSFG